MTLIFLKVGEVSTVSESIRLLASSDATIGGVAVTAFSMSNGKALHLGEIPCGRQPMAA